MEMIEDGLMWADESMAAEGSSSNMDQRLMFFALNYASVEKILAPEGAYIKQQSRRLEVESFSFAELEQKKSSLPAHSIIFEPYDRKEKQKILNSEVKPLMVEIFETNDPATKFNSLHWSDFVEFFVNLIWCSRLQIPFVMDLKTLRRQVPAVARRLMHEKALKDPRPFLELLVILERFKEMELSFFVPQRDQARKPLEVWNQLRTSVEFRRMATEKRSLGKAFDINSQTRIVERLAMNSERAPKVNPIIAKVAGVGKAKTWVFREPETRIQTPGIKALVQEFLEGGYCAPVYDYPSMKSQSRYIFAPTVSKFS